MLTSRPAQAALWWTAHVGAMIVLSIVAATSADAGDVDMWSCVGGWRGFNCVERSGPAIDPYVRPVPEPFGEVEKEGALARDRKWLARCRPVIEQGRYGVTRYHYAAPGCEFGVGGD